MNWTETGRFLVIAGIVIAAIGCVFLFSDKLPIGRLPGDIHFEIGRSKVFIPLATSILLSIILTIILNFFSRR